MRVTKLGTMGSIVLKTIINTNVTTVSKFHDKKGERGLVRQN